jgi:hypothetical protein
MSDLETLEAGIRHVKALLGLVVEDRSPLVIASALDAVNTVGGQLRGAEAEARDAVDRDVLSRLSDYFQRLNGALYELLPEPMVR